MREKEGISLGATFVGIQGRMEFRKENSSDPEVEERLGGGKEERLRGSGGSKGERLTLTSLGVEVPGRWRSKVGNNRCQTCANQRLSEGFSKPCRS